MSFEVRCPQCQFLTQQLGQSTPCLLHVSIEPDAEVVDDVCAAEVAAHLDAGADYDEPYAFGELHVSVDRPGPFTLREYVRLQLLRTRVQAERSSADSAAGHAQGTSLSRR